MPNHRRTFKTWLPGSLALMLIATTAAAQIIGEGQAGSAGAGLPTRLQYQSVFGAYQADVDPPLQSWREANDRVRQIGGWRAYAREAVDPHADHHGGAKP